MSSNEQGTGGNVYQFARPEKVDVEVQYDVRVVSIEDGRTVLVLSSKLGDGELLTIPVEELHENHWVLTRIHPGANHRESVALGRFQGQQDVAPTITALTESAQLAEGGRVIATLKGVGIGVCIGMLVAYALMGPVGLVS